MLKRVVRAVVVAVAGVSFGLAGSVGQALAQSEMKKDDTMMKKDEMMKKEMMKKEEMKKDDMNKDDMNKGEMAKDGKTMMKDDKMEKKP